MTEVPLMPQNNNAETARAKMSTVAAMDFDKLNFNINQ